MINPTEAAKREAFEAHCEAYGIFPKDAYFKLWQAAQAHARAEMGAEVARLRETLKEYHEAAEAFISDGWDYATSDTVDRWKTAEATVCTTLAEPQPTGAGEG